MFRDGEEFSKSLLNEVNILLVVLDTASNNQALLGSNIIHDELLDQASINVVEIALKTNARHAKSVITISGTEKEILILREGIILVEVLMNIVSLLVL